MDTVKT